MWVAIIAAVLTAAAAAYQGYTSYKQAETQEAINNYNAKVAENQALQAQMEKSVALDQQREEAKRRIAAGRAAMAASGNVGSASQAAELNAWYNLDEDESYTNWNYDTKSQAFKSQAALDKFSAGVSHANGVSALVGGGLNTLSAIAGGANSIYNLYPGSNLVKDINGNTLGKVGGYGSWGNP